jgi:5-methyltetrahydrofolate--homocysteine methyltransferase
VPPRPPALGLRSFNDYELGELVPYVDWTPLFRTWELKGTFPRIFDDPVVGEVARSLYDDAEAMLGQIVAERWISANAVVGFWPANSVVDDIAVYEDEQRLRPVATLHTLRQQLARDAAHANHALADFVAPTGSGVADYIGAFAVTTGHREEVRSEQFARENDDYNAILFKALCDRLAEAFAERMHEWVRREGWGYEPEESLSREELIAEGYRGIRPAPGYGCQPDHTEKETLFALLDAPARAGIHLTDSFAMIPGSSVSGIYLSHPEARYFGVGRIGFDQLEDYAARKGWTIEKARRWLAPILDGDTSELPAAA